MKFLQPLLHLPYTITSKVHRNEKFNLLQKTIPLNFYTGVGLFNVCENVLWKNYGFRYFSLETLFTGHLLVSKIVLTLLFLYHFLALFSSQQCPFWCPTSFPCSCCLSCRGCTMTVSVGTFSLTDMCSEHGTAPSTLCSPKVFYELTGSVHLSLWVELQQLQRDVGRWGGPDCPFSHLSFSSYHSSYHQQ